MEEGECVMHIKFNPFPVLETERLVLREIRKDDVNMLYQVLGDPEVAKYDYFYPVRKIEEVYAFIDRYKEEAEAGEEITWGVVVKATNELVGTCGLGNFEQGAKRAEIGYCIRRSEWGKGYGTEASEALVKYGFEVMGLNRIEGLITPGNDASVRVLEKLSFKNEGLLRERDLIKGKLEDGIMMALLKREYDSLLSKIAHFFEGWEETAVWSCLQGCMGKAFADDRENPKAAGIVVGDFCFVAGEPTGDLVKQIVEQCEEEGLLVVPKDERWHQVIEELYAGKYEKFMRYAIKKEKDVFDKEKLQSYIEAIPSTFAIKQIDEMLFNETRKEDWSRDLCSNFKSYETYEKYGLGYVVIHEEKIERGLYPSWDAANKASVALAEQLGYHFDREYVTYCIMK